MRGIRRRLVEESDRTWSGGPPCRSWARGADRPSAAFAGVGDAAEEDDGVDAGFPDEEQEGPIGDEALAVYAEGAPQSHHSGGRRRLTALLIHLKRQADSDYTLRGSAQDSLFVT